MEKLCASLILLVLAFVMVGESSPLPLSDIIELELEHTLEGGSRGAVDDGDNNNLKCAAGGEPCGWGNYCCKFYQCAWGVCTQSCQFEGEACGFSTGWCCKGLACGGGGVCIPTCNKKGESCGFSKGFCCGATVSCLDGVCQ